MKVDFMTQPPEFDARLLRQAFEKTNEMEIKTEPVEEKSVQARDLEILQDILAQHGVSLKFGRDDETGQIIVKMIDSKNGDVVRQIPSEVSVALSKVFEKIQGRFIDEHI